MPNQIRLTDAQPFAAERSQEAMENSTSTVRPYQVVLLHNNECEIADEVKNMLKEKLDHNPTSETLIKNEVLVFLKHVPKNSKGLTVVVVYLMVKNPDPNNKRINCQIRRALENLYPVLPIVESSKSASQLPEKVQKLNASYWDDEWNKEKSIMAILEMLGLVEEERKVFLSYKRESSTRMAVQLYNRLMQDRFQVFLDRFTLKPGVNFQKRLFEHLADKAFVVLLESSDIHKSIWVKYEINYAFTNGISVLAITHPDVSKDKKMMKKLDKLIKSVFRHKLDDKDCEDNSNDPLLTDEALDQILGKIRTRHAMALRRRREELFGSLERYLKQGGWSDLAHVGNNWAISAEHSQRGHGVFSVTPRVPRVQDLHDVHVLCEEHGNTGSMVSGTVAHGVEHISRERSGLLKWITQVGKVKTKKLRNVTK